MRTSWRWEVATVLMTAGLLCAAAPASAAGESFKALKVNTTGCTSGAFTLTVEKAGFDAGAYIIRTVVTVDDLIYMNEAASNPGNGQTNWSLLNTLSYGPVPNPGTWPIPQNRQMFIDFTLERPQGTILFAWTTVVDGCNTGAFLYNGLRSEDEDRDLVAVPQDKCPTLRAERPNGCPLLPRSLTLVYRANREKFTGRLFASGHPELFARRTVTIWKARRGPDKKFASVKTKRSGRFKVAGEPDKGRYYALAGGQLIPTLGEAIQQASRRVGVG